MKDYEEIVSKYTPKENRLINGFIAFVSGGLLGIIGQSLIDLYIMILNINKTEAGALMIVTLIFIGSLFTALGFFDKWVNIFKAGLIIPITGFAHSTTSAAMEYRNEGLVTGIGSNMFKLSGTVIIYGVVSAYVFGTIRFLIMGG